MTSTPQNPYRRAPVEPNKRHAAAAFWAARSPRERQWVLGAGALLLLAAVGIGLVKPAWQAVRQGPERHAQLDAQLQQLQALAAQAQRLQGASPLPRSQRLQALETATASHLKPSGQVRVNADQVTVTFAGTPPEALAQWMADVRVSARLLPDDVQLGRVGAGQPLWQGTAVFTLPPN